MFHLNNGHMNPWTNELMVVLPIVNY